MVTMMRQITALFANQFVMQAAIGYVGSSVVGAEILLEASSRVLLVGL